MASIKLPFDRPGDYAVDPPKIAGTYRGTVIVVGSASCLWEDLVKLDGIESDLMAVNDSGCFVPRRPQHWVSLHAEHFQWWLPLRKDVRIDAGAVHTGQPIHTHSVRHCAGVTHVWPTLMVPKSDGGSGLAAIRIALQLGYENVILAGIPMAGNAHFYDPPNHAKDCDYGQYMGAVISAAEHEFKGRVRSMSGNTRELLGAP